MTLIENSRRANVIGHVEEGSQSSRSWLILGAVS